MNKIFISHSSKDKGLVDFVLELLMGPFRIEYDDIFCTSRSNSLIVGEDFIKHIKDNLNEARIVFFLITPNYIESKFCLMEMGAAWAFKDNIVPLIIPPLYLDTLSDTPLKNIQSVMLTDLDSLIDNLYERKLVNGGIIPRLNSSAERQLAKYISDFVDKVKAYSTYTYGANFKEVQLIPIAQNGDPDAMEIEKDGDIYTFRCNFEPNKYYPQMSNFTSGVMQFNPHRNWCNIFPNGILEFECRSRDTSIQKLTVEIKSGDNIFKVFDNTYLLTSNFQKVSISINPSTIPSNHLKNISELCFVIRPNFVPSFKGELEIKNIGIR